MPHRKTAIDPSHLLGSAHDATLPSLVPQSGSDLLAMHQHDLDRWIGQTFNDYTVESLLGAGAMGRVYLARHRGLHRRCALKLLPPSLVERDPAYIERFRREGRAAAALSHPNVILVHACGENAGHHFLEMEFVPGLSLERLLEDEHFLSPERATRIMARVADGLAAAHQASILHRDLKPGNILLTLQGAPKLSDFGLAKSVNTTTDVSLDGVAGTPPYMAPELFQGQPATPASDVYALGVCYFELLTGEKPFQGATLSELVRSILTADLPDLSVVAPDTSRDVRECLHQLLAKAPANRPRDGLEAAMLLQAVLGHEQLDLSTLIDQAFSQNSHVRVERDREAYRLTVHLAEGRSQVVFVRESDHVASERLLEIESICSPALTHYMEAALRLNGEIAHGGLAIRDYDGKPMFVAIDNYPRSTVDPEEIRRSVLEAARRADAIEHILTGQDVH